MTAQEHAESLLAGQTTTEILAGLLHGRCYTCGAEWPFCPHGDRWLQRHEEE